MDDQYSKNKFVNMVSTLVCSKKSIIGDALERFLGEAKSCWCCTAVRMFLLTSAFWVIILLLTLIKG